MSQIRYCILKNRYSIIEPKRAIKPFSFKIEENINIKCPFCEENSDMIEIEILRTGTCRVVANQFNALAIESDNSSKREGFFEYRNGFGAHEVIIETPHHRKKMGDYTIDEFIDYFSAINRRFVDLKKDFRIKYVQLFKNSGVLAGASLYHEHSQIIALPFVPKNVIGQIERNREYKNIHSRSLIGDIVDEEIRLNERIVAINSEFVAFCPYGSLFPFEVIIAPIAEISSFEYLSKFDELASIFKRVFHSMYETIGHFSFNIYLHNIKSGRFYFDITPRIYQMGGFELSSEIFINPIVPETAANQLRESV
jgi:UDPglucose--hexose-1-phosphate uridylyltransferase